MVTAQLKAQKDMVFPIATPKHEIGFSWGAISPIGIVTLDDNVTIPFPCFSRNDRQAESHENVYHLGSFSLNYNYHFKPKHSAGVSLSWLGKHVDVYWLYPHYSFSFPSAERRLEDYDTIDSKGWHHYFILMGNYRYTYYRKNIITLYFAVHAGATLCVINEKVSIYHIKDREKYVWLPAFQLTALGIDIGRKNVFNLELGVGTQGVIKLGYKFKK
jgi:hypothetical protein